MMCPPSSLNKSRIGGLLKFDSPHTQILKFRLNGELSLTCLTCYTKKMNPRECNSTAQQELEQFMSCTLSGLSMHTSDPVQLQCPMSMPDSCSAPMLSVCGPACRTGCALGCSFPCTPHFGHGDWPCSLPAVDTLTKSRPTVPNTHLHQWAWAAHTCQSAVQTTLLCAQPCIYVQAA